MNTIHNEQRDALVRLYTLAVLLGELMERGLAERGLTRSRASAIWELHRLGPVTQRVLSDALRVTPRHVTGLLDALEAAGLVERQSHPSDRRATLVHLTEEGRGAAATLETENQAFATALFADIPPDDFATFIRVFDQVLDRLRQTASRVDPR